MTIPPTNISATVKFITKYMARVQGEYSRKVYTGRLRPEVQPLTLLYTIYDRKGTPFVYLLSFATNGTPFTYLVWNAAYILTAVIQIPLNMN